MNLPHNLLDATPAPNTVRAWITHLGPTAHQTSAEVRATLTAGGTIPEVAAAIAARHPDRRAVGVDGTWLTHGQLDDLAGRTAGVLDLEPSATVLLSARNSLALVVAYLAVLRTGATVLLANPDYTTSELDHLIKRAAVTVAIGDTEVIQRLAGVDLPTRWLLSPDRSDDPRDLLGQARSAPSRPVAEIAPDSVAILAHTSGTTGKPKGVPISHSCLLSSVRGITAAWRWRDDDLLLHGLPLSHQHGMTGVHTALTTGAATMVQSRFDPARLVREVGELGATVVFTVPAMLSRLLEDPEGQQLSTCRLITSGSAALPPDLARSARDRLGNLPLERYGSTEGGLNLSNPYDGPRKPGRVGMPLPGVEIAVIDPENQEPVTGPRPSGELVIRGPQVFGGYVDEADSALLPGGWFRTGDLVEVDDEGSVAIVGRAKELIITGGMNVHPREVENALRDLGGVSDAAVYGEKSERWGEEVVAAVVLQGRDDVEGLTAALREVLAPYKVPKRIWATPTIPRTTTGKVDGASLRKQLGG